MQFIVQASSKSWAGDIEHCVNKVDGYPAVYWTLKRIVDNFLNANITLIAPEYDTGGQLDEMKNYFSRLKILYAHDSSPLLRMIEATKHLDDSDFFIRLNALNFQFEISFFKQMIHLAKENQYDCVKLQDDYPAHFTGEVYKVGALPILLNILASGKIKDPEIHEIHPKFLLMKLAEFKTNYFYPENEIDVKVIEQYQQKMRQIIHTDRHNVSGNKQILSGDQLTYHYTLAKDFLHKKNIVSGKLLDIACGTGFGVKMFNNMNFEIIAADYDNELIKRNNKSFEEYKDINFKHEDITNMSFPDNFFDAVFSMETMEHVDPEKALIELKRVIKKNAYLILSTPQNCTTTKCVNPQHLYEYSLEEIKKIVSQYFLIDSIIGLKAGRIYFEDDPIGASTLIFAQNTF